MSITFERFSARAQRALSLAQLEAQRLNHSHIEPEHLLLALTQLDDGAAAEALRNAGLRAKLVLRNEKLGAKIRDARNLRIPFMAVVGDTEVEEGTVALRTAKEQLGTMSLDAAVAFLRDACAMPGVN